MNCLGEYNIGGCFEVALDAIFITMDENYRIVQNLQTLFEKSNIDTYFAVLATIPLVMDEGISQNVNKVSTTLYNFNSKMTARAKDNQVIIRDHVHEFVMQALRPENQIQMSCGWSLWL